MRSSDGEGRSIRSDAFYPAQSGEWEVPVTRNAKITPVNEGGGGRGRGASPPGSPLAGSPVTRNAEIDPPGQGRGLCRPDCLTGSADVIKAAHSRNCDRSRPIRASRPQVQNQPKPSERPVLGRLPL